MMELTRPSVPVTSPATEAHVAGQLMGQNYEVLRAAYDRELALRSVLGKDVKDCNFSEFVLALAVVSAGKEVLR